MIQIRMRLDLDQGPEITFRSVGVNRATVFTGLCAQHDSVLFGPIEHEEVDLTNREHLFLLAYRAFLRETHASMEAAARLLSTYQKQCELGLVDANEITRGGMIAVQRGMVAYQLWLYKQEIDRAFVRGDLDIIVHDVLCLGQTGPCIAVSALFSLDDVPVRDDVARVALTVLPAPEGQTHAIFAYTKRDASPARRRLRSVLRAPSSALCYRVSRLVLDTTENIVISPLHFARFSPDKRKTILDFFCSTVLASAPEFNHPDLNLFEIAQSNH